MHMYIYIYIYEHNYRYDMVKYGITIAGSRSAALEDMQAYVT